MVKGLTAMLPLRNFLRCLCTFVLATALAAPAWAQQPRTFQYIYDDIGQIKKAIDTITGECIVYSYDEVGNITAIDRQTNCLAPPTFQSITPGSSPNCFTVTGQNLLGATVTTDIAGATVTDVMSSDGENQVSFCLSATEQFCERTGIATVSTPTGSFDVPVSASSTTPLDPDVAVTDGISTVGEKDTYCFTLAVTTRVIVQAVGTSGVKPCLEVLTGAGQPPVSEGSDCAFMTSDITARVDKELAAGTYFVLAYANGNGGTGNYTLVLEPITGGTPLTSGTPTNDTLSPVGDLDLFTFSLTATKQVTIQVTPSGIQPCIELFKGTPAQPVGGSTCSNGTAQLNISLDPETYFVLISDNGTNNTGSFSVLLQVP